VKVYLDNVIASARIRDDLASPEERKAFKLIQEHDNFGKLEIVTSRESWREQERTRNAEAREELRASRGRRQLYRTTTDYWALTALISGIEASSRRR
jgi:hypothetical protein